MNILSKFNLTGLRAVITGASQGIGLGAAKALGEAGAHVILTARNEAKLKAAVTDLKLAGISAEYMLLDVTDSKMVSELATKLGDINILVANAGIALSGEAAETVSDKIVLEVMNVNFNGVYWCCREFGRHMLSKGKGSIVTIGSISALISNIPQCQSYYNSSKAAVHHMTKSLASEWASRGVRVNCVAPGYIESPMTKFGMDENPEMASKWLSLTPMGRVGQVDEIASIILFLASPASSYMTGSIVVADGGYTIW